MEKASTTSADPPKTTDDLLTVSFRSLAAAMAPRMAFVTTWIASPPANIVIRGAIAPRRPTKADRPRLADIDSPPNARAAPVAPVPTRSSALLAPDEPKRFAAAPNSVIFFWVEAIPSSNPFVLASILTLSFAISAAIPAPVPSCLCLGKRKAASWPRSGGEPAAKRAAIGVSTGILSGQGATASGATCAHVGSVATAPQRSQRM